MRPSTRPTRSSARSWLSTTRSSALTRHCPATSVEANTKSSCRVAWGPTYRTNHDVVACTQELVRPRVRTTTNWRGRAHEEQPPCSHSVKDSRIASGPVGAPVLPIGVAPVAGRYAVRLLPRGIHRKGDEGSLDWCRRPPLHVDAARELDDRRAPEPMPSTRCPPRGWMAFERRRHVSRRRRRFLNLLRPRVFLDT